MAEHYLTVAGCKTFMTRTGGAGKKPVLIYLHDELGARLARRSLTAFEDSFDVIVPDHPGFGASDTPAWLDRVGDLGYFYSELISQVSDEPVCLVGSSLGAWIAAEVAIRNRQRVGSLVLCAPFGIRIKGVPRPDYFMLSDEEFLRAWFKNGKMADEAIAAEGAPENLETRLKNKLTVARLGWQPRLYDPDLEKWLSLITAPTVFVGGKDDGLVPPAAIEGYKARVAGAKAVILDDCGHSPAFERTESVLGEALRISGGI